jgi:hypothetical protein
MTDLSDRPFFIVGSPRSGTTLLRFVLSSHPRLYVPSETGFLPFLGYDGDATLTLAQAQTVLERIGTLNREWAGLVDDVETFYQRLPDPSLAHLLDALYRRKVAAAGAAAALGRWGDKTPGYALHLPLLARLFRTAQFVHVVRDGRDVALSAQNKWGRWYMDSYYLLRNWVRHVEQARQAGQGLPPSRYLEVRYEDLVREPEPAIRAICDFLDEIFQPTMLDHTRLAQQQIAPGGHVEVWQPISTASVGRWRTGMSPFWQKAADRIAGPTLAASGYELSGQGAPTAAERARLLALAAKYALTDGARRGLARLGLLTLNRGKRSK